MLAGRVSMVPMLAEFLLVPIPVNSELFRGSDFIGMGTKSTGNQEKLIEYGNHRKLTEYGNHRNSPRFGSHRNS